MKRSYICLITKEGDIYKGVFPDLNFTTLWGKTFKEVIYKTKEAGELYCGNLKELPLKTSIEDLCEKYNHRNLAVGIVLNLNNLDFEESQKEAFECLNDLDKFNKLQDA